MWLEFADIFIIETIGFMMTLGKKYSKNKYLTHFNKKTFKRFIFLLYLIL
jgi:hypothetical protein